MKQIKILSRVDENGNLKRNRKFIADAIKSFSGKEIEIIIKRKYKQRSTMQNAFYWGITLPFFQNLFHDAWGEIRSIEEIHEILKATCNYTEIPNPEQERCKKYHEAQQNSLLPNGWITSYKWNNLHGISLT